MATKINHIALICLCVFVGGSLFGQHVQLQSFPKNLQLYPRNKTTNQAKVEIKGILDSTSLYTHLVSNVYKNGLLWQTKSQPIAQNNPNNPRPFNLFHHIDADTVLYRFELIGYQAATQNLLLAQADSVVAGDVFLVEGQSNASGLNYGNCPNANLCDKRYLYVRSFGYRGDDTLQTRNRTQWSVAQNGNNWSGNGFIGSWAMFLANQINKQYAMPVAIVSGAMPGNPMNYFLPNAANPSDLNTNYGRLLYRCKQAKIDSNVSGLFNYQGENDCSQPNSYLMGLQTLKTAWQRDYHNLSQFFIFQMGNIAPICPDAGLEVRERQRLFANRNPNNVHLIGTTANGFLHIDSIHYLMEGNKKLGQDAFYQLQKTIYGSNLSNLESPKPLVAYFLIPNRLVLELENTLDRINIDNHLAVANDFVLEGTTAAVQTIVLLGNNKILLECTQNAYLASGLTYQGHAGNASGWVQNANKIGLVAFKALPISANPTLQNLESQTQHNIRFVVYPNPSTNLLYVAPNPQPTDDQPAVDILIIDAMGKNILTKKNIKMPQNQPITIDLKPLDKGVYSLIIQNEKMFEVKKIIKH